MTIGHVARLSSCAGPVEEEDVLVVSWAQKLVGNFSDTE